MDDTEAIFTMIEDELSFQKRQIAARILDPYHSDAETMSKDSFAEKTLLALSLADKAELTQAKEIFQLLEERYEEASASLLNPQLFVYVQHCDLLIEPLYYLRRLAVRFGDITRQRYFEMRATGIIEHDLDCDLQRLPTRFNQLMKEYLSARYEGEDDPAAGNEPQD